MAYQCRSRLRSRFLHRTRADRTTKRSLQRLRRRLQTCYDHGCQLTKDKDYDYGHEMFTECVTKNPANLVYVEAPPSNLQRKYDNNRKGARFKGFGGKGVLKKAVNSQDWEQVFQLGPELLKTNPWDVPTPRARPTPASRGTTTRRSCGT